MSVTSGFFNSVNGDRRYDARQMTALFNGIINDGIFASIGKTFAVKANGGNEVAVDTGRAWFNSTWVDNDALLPLTLKQPEVLLNRYDAVVIEIDESDAVRAGNIKVVTGTPSTTPSYPTMVKTNEVHQYPLAYIYRTAGSTEVTQSNITNAVGTSSAPYITGILQVQNIDNIVAQWQDEWAQWFAKETAEVDQSFSAKENELDSLIDSKESEINSWISATKSDTESWINSKETEINNWFSATSSETASWIANQKNDFTDWSDDQKAEFDTWFADIQAVLDSDIAASLSGRVLALENGTTPAGEATNALQLGDQTAEAWQTKIDSIQTTSTATLSSAGWYRVAEIAKTHPSIIGIEAESCFLSIKKASSISETYLLRLDSTTDGQRIRPISVKSTPNGISITKVRYVYTS